MSTSCWIMEYGKVLCGYLFLMFVWPSVVFGRYLGKKPVTYRFSFCVTVQVVLLHLAVLALGLLHIADSRIVPFLFYGIFAAALLRHLICRTRLANGVRLPIAETLLLSVLLLYGMLYFSYGAFYHGSYGSIDMYSHHLRVYELTKGTVSLGGVYPGAMHCFIYCLHALFGIRIYSIMLFLAGIHVMVFLVSAYVLMREIFRWRYTPFFVLTLFLVLDARCSGAVDSYAALQWTLPQEFGLYTLFLSVRYLLRCLRPVCGFSKEDRRARRCRGENLFLLVMSLAAFAAICFPAAVPFSPADPVQSMDSGFALLYGQTRAWRLTVLIGLSAVLYLIFRSLEQECLRDICRGYPLALLWAVCFMLPPVISCIDKGQWTAVHMLILIAAAMPADVVCSVLAVMFGNLALRVFSALCVPGICILAVSFGSYHGYLYWNLLRPHSAAAVTDSVRENFPAYSYTIVAPTDDLYQVLQYGYHTELLTFFEGCSSMDYTLPTEYVFIYIEKNALYYDQLHFLQGPGWLALQKYTELYPGTASQCPKIYSGEISEEAAQKELIYSDAWSAYSDHENRRILEAKVYGWCLRFSQLYPQKMNVYYEDEDFICWYYRQEPDHPYNLAIE